jgi:hypothetical protein
MKRSLESRTRFGSAARVFVCLAAAGFAAGTARADTRGFFLGFGVHSSGIGAEEKTESAPAQSVFVDENGGGVTLLAGYGFTPAFVVRFSLCGSSHETTDPDVDVLYSIALFEAQYLFRPGRTVRPYVLGGIGGCSLESRADPFRFETTGPGTSLGAGLLYFPGEHFAFDAAMRFEFINWEKSRAELVTDQGTLVVETPVEDEGAAVKVLLGATYWF